MTHEEEFKMACRMLAGRPTAKDVLAQVSLPALPDIPQPKRGPWPKVRHGPRGRVVCWFRQGVTEGHLQVGDALPSERAIAVDLGVGRKAVRAAMSDLETAGFVGVAPGSNRRRVRKGVS